MTRNRQWIVLSLLLMMLGSLIIAYKVVRLGYPAKPDRRVNNGWYRRAWKYRLWRGRSVRVFCYRCDLAVSRSVTKISSPGGLG